MKHRDLHVALCGVVAGVLLGATALAASGPFQASVPSITPAATRLHSAPTRTQFVRRNISKKDLKLYNDDGINPYPTIKAESSSSNNVTAPVLTPATCDAVKNAVARIRKVYDDVIVEAIGNIDLRARMSTIIDDAADDGCAK